jgi:hypothetical protein
MTKKGGLLYPAPLVGLTPDPMYPSPVAPNAPKPSATKPRGAKPRPNPFRLADIGGRSDGEVLDHVGIYRALLRRLGPRDGAAPGASRWVRDEVEAALSELEAEAARRGLAR